MLCTFIRLIYPKTPPAEDSGYRIALYQPCEKLRDAAGRPVTEVKAVGFFLPTGENLSYELKGRWARDSKYGVQFEVEGYEEIITPTKEGIIGYLSSGQVKGIGPKTAEKIFQAFGMDTLRILDEEPERLLSIPGISEGKLKKIQESYLANRGARDVVAFLVPHGVTPNRAVKVYQAFGKETMDILRRHPYRLCEVAGIGFLTADQIARSLGLDPRSPERVDAALLHTLQEAEQREAVAFQFKDLWCRQRRLSLDVCLVYGGLDIWWEKEDKTVYIDMSSRYSILYHRIGGIWKVVHIYQSVPNVEQAPGEYYPKRLSDQVESARRLALRMEDLALRDGLTQLYNYRGLEKM